MRVATVDIGTNSLLLLVADVDRQLAIRPLHQRAITTRLGQGVDRTRRLHPAAVDRTIAALRDLAAIIAAANVDRVAAVATSALRDASDGEEFLRLASQTLGVRPEVITGSTEAALSFDGATIGLALAPGRVALCDVGGGSTEIMTGHVDDAGQARLDDSCSLDLGSVRLTERLLCHDPPSSDELARCRDALRRELPTAPTLGGGPLVGIGGTVTSLAAVAHEVWPYDADRIHGARLSRSALEETLSRLATIPLAERKQVAPLDPKRADVIVAGALIVSELMAHARAEELLISDRGLRWGLARRLAATG